MSRATLDVFHFVPPHPIYHLVQISSRLLPSPVFVALHFFCSIDADTEGALVRRRGPLALVLGLSRARAIEAQRRTASRLYLTFLQGTLEKKWALDHVDLASLKVP